ncbi:MAG: phospho-N-acetylmuramoyl-pentapeptide-transferase [Spirochaetota bacterium]
MVRELLYPLVKYFSVFNIFQYITFRAAYASVTALFISFILYPRLITLLRRLKAGQSIRHDGPETHLSKLGTPTMGGILVNLSIIFSVLLWQNLGSMYTWITIVAVLGFGLIGFVDDYLKVFRHSSEGLKAKFKFIAQIILSTAIVIFLYRKGDAQASYLYLPFIKYPILDLSAVYIPFGIILLVLYSNAVNLTDGLDGLAAGLLIMVGLSFAILSYLTGRADYAGYLQIPYLPESGELTIFCLALVGACVGFLWFNCHPAEIMLGDTGSLSLGGVIGVIALMIKKEILLLIVGGVFVLEALSVIIQVSSFKLRGKRVFKMAPLHHHFELKGWAESKVVIRFWILGGLFAILGLSTLKLQ